MSHDDIVRAQLEQSEELLRAMRRNLSSAHIADQCDYPGLAHLCERNAIRLLKTALVVVGEDPALYSSEPDE